VNWCRKQHRFFPELLAEPFMTGIKIAFSISILLYLASALISWLGGSTRKQERAEEIKLANAESKAA
jgi:type II secretory pathway pseudopilin PulG